MNRFELADVMLRGLHTPKVIENRKWYIATMNTLCHACALGAGWIGQCGGNFRKAEQTFNQAHSSGFLEDEAATLANLLEIPIELAIQIEQKHLDGMPIEQIAAWLKSSEGGEV